jgi:hypothetical protein
MESDEDIVNLGAEAVERQYLVLDEKDPLHTPVMTRDGRPARLLCVDFKNPRYPIMAGVMTSRSRERALFYSGSGRACPEKPTKIDLVNKRPELESIKTT